MAPASELMSEEAVEAAVEPTGQAARAQDASTAHSLSAYEPGVGPESDGRAGVRHKRSVEVGSGGWPQAGDFPARPAAVDTPG